MKGYDVCLTLKTVRHWLYEDIQLLPVPMYCWKDLLIDFVIGLPVFKKWKSETCNSILVIVDRLIKMVYYKLVQVTINTRGLANVIIIAIIRYYGLQNLTVSD